MHVWVSYLASRSRLHEIGEDPADDARLRATDVGRATLQNVGAALTGALMVNRGAHCLEAAVLLLLERMPRNDRGVAPTRGPDLPNSNHP